MTPSDDSPALAAARASFAAATERYRRQLVVHCYRLVGSHADAEDLVQEALLKAWRARPDLAEVKNVRAWLYRIATNVCLDSLGSGRLRRLPPEVVPAGDPRAAPASVAGAGELLWLEPLPDSLLADDPEESYARAQGLSLAFLSLLQTLPARQRAVLVLHDVLGWSAAEVGEALETSVAAVNSALQRARASLGDGGKVEPPPPSDERTRELVRRYVAAWQERDVDGLVSLLRQDAVLAMPPTPFWLAGRDDVVTFLRGLFANVQVLRILPTGANGQPALAIWAGDGQGGFKPTAIQLLTIREGQVARMDSFLDPALFPRFGLGATPPP